MRPKLHTKSKTLKSIFAADTSLSLTPRSSLLWFLVFVFVFKHGISLQEVMLLTLQGGMRLLATTSSFMKDDRVTKTVALISLLVYTGKEWGINSVRGEIRILFIV